jgi:hypothetical protein
VGSATLRFVQWILGLAVVTVCGVGTVWLLSPGEAERLRREKELLDRELTGLQQAIERLTGEDRLAEVHVVDQVLRGQLVDGQRAPSTVTTIDLVEIDRGGHPLPPRRFVIPDEVIYFDYWVIQFEHAHVAAGDALRGRSLALFRRVFGEHQNPADGYGIDPVGGVPQVYRIDPESSRYERQLWSRFWQYVTDPALAADDGVRVAQGEAVYVPVRKGQIWTLTLQNAGGLNVKLRRTGVPLGASPEVASD